MAGKATEQTTSFPCELTLETRSDGQVYVDFTSWAFDEADGVEKIHTKMLRGDTEQPVDGATRREIEALAHELAGKLAGVVS